MTSAAVRRILFAILFLSLARVTAPQLWRGVRESMRLLPKSYAERQAHVNGPFYAAVRRLKTELPPGEPFALILRQSRDIDIAVFVNYYLYPAKSRIYSDLGLYRNDPKKPQIVVGVDSTREPQVKWLPYPELRAEHTGTDFIVKDIAATSEPLQAFDVPLVCSLDGPAPEWYVTEAVIENGNDAPARVRMELLPQRKTFELTIEPRGRMIANDLVYQAFKVMDQGWLRVQSDRPVRAGFWFVNRGRRMPVPLHLMSYGKSSRVNAPKGAKFYVVNPSEVALMAKLPHGEFFVGGLQYISGSTPASPMTATSDAPFYTFATWRGSNGETFFGWPQ